MKFSVVTPTHICMPYLRDLYDSIMAQTYEDWEWVVYVNRFPPTMRIAKDFDKRVKVYRETKRPNNNIGRIKKEAFSKAKGEILVQVDHDDMITPDCLEKLNEAFKDKTGCVISNYIRLPSNMKFESFVPNGNLTKWKLPIHIVAWRKKLYKKIGGFDKDLEIGEDMDILIRTHLATKIKKIPDYLYKYRVTGQNSFIELGWKMRETVYGLQKKYERELNAKV